MFSDVCLEAEASPRGSLEPAKVLPRPRLKILMPRLGLDVMASVSSPSVKRPPPGAPSHGRGSYRRQWLEPSNRLLWVGSFLLLKGPYSMRKPITSFAERVFRCKLSVFGVCVCVCVCVLPHEFSLIHLNGFLTAFPGLVNAVSVS